MQIKREEFRAKPAKVAKEGFSFRNLFAFWCAGTHTQSPSSATQSTLNQNSPAAPNN
jgi:hypothetical protein